MLDRFREPAKGALRATLARRGLGIGADPFEARVVRTLDALGVGTVLDVGANVGQYGALLRAHGWSGRLVSFEPLPSAHARLARRAAHDGDWTTRRVALGSAPGEAVLHVAGNSYSSSLLPMTPLHLRADPGSGYTGEVTVPVSTLTSEVASLGVDPATSLLKIDTQGFEGAVLDGAGTVLETLAAVQVEVSAADVYDGQVPAPALLARLADAGFRPWTFGTGIADDRGRQLQADVLLVRADGPLGGDVVRWGL